MRMVLNFEAHHHTHHHLRQSDNTMKKSIYELLLLMLLITTSTHRAKSFFVEQQFHDELFAIGFGCSATRSLVDAKKTTTRLLLSSSSFPLSLRLQNNTHRNNKDDYDSVETIATVSALVSYQCAEDRFADALEDWKNTTASAPHCLLSKNIRGQWSIGGCCTRNNG